MDSIERLQEYVNMDGIYQDFKNGKDVFSDFDMFCVEHCKDIEELLERVKELEDDLYAANECVNELLDVQEENERLKEDFKLMDSACVTFKNDFIDYSSRIDKARHKLNIMFSNGNEDTILDDLLELDKILQGEDNDKD